MSVGKNIELHITPPVEPREYEPETTTPTDTCNINIQVANGWEITGHYQNKMLQTITLQKSAEAEVK